MIGAPVTHVRTPPILEAFLQAEAGGAEVPVRHVGPEGLADFMAGVRDDPGVDGLMVTMPHKRAILPFLDGLSEIAAFTGSVNAVKRRTSGELVGAQFDGIALVRAVLAAGVPLGGCRVLLAGVGGAGLAIGQALLRSGCTELVVTDTDEGFAARAVERLSRYGRCRAREAGDDNFGLLVNATPLGMEDGDPSPFTQDMVRRSGRVADIVADPPRTALAAQARDAGAVLVTGRDMVAGQIEPIGRWLLHDRTEQD